MDKRIIAAILGVMALIVVGLGILIFIQVRGPSVPVYEADTFSGDADSAAPAIDSGARIEIEKLRQQIEGLTEEVNRLQGEINRLESSRAPATAPRDGGLTPFVPDGDNQIVGSYAQVVLIAARRELNKGVRIASPSYLESVFGKPREVLSSRCETMTNKRLADKLRVDTVGPIRVQMLQPAIDSLREVFEKIRTTDPDLYDRINTSGSLCVRHIRGAPGRTSTHAFGLSVDLNIDGRLDTLGDGKTQLGLTILADFFRDAGWYWGAGFTREDSMHFEASRDLVEKWIAEGKL
ncbi:hypothetical protein OB2597_13528 [Pseudooceanicola batsensis HTCC2597]|uniref:Peptidase M15C domain-containing protein n=1 Tax=Pseudooceanicola batsensis (strain ATCC BAA-863 / DSM 15984 / KCTC 12145 / HTCC2597) TaxID=252305 RepID=A3TYD4_PSEBH|nr:M15 family metallopeptidase [Pseudooceanicola batsensis]EAQ03168.1 hypothetical protein OB2597_13528 [Pseudooceanicola batsensis HTCC2597]